MSGRRCTGLQVALLRVAVLVSELQSAASRGEPMAPDELKDFIHTLAVTVEEVNEQIHHHNVCEHNPRAF